MPSSKVSSPVLWNASSKTSSRMGIKGTSSNIQEPSTRFGFSMLCAGMDAEMLSSSLGVIFILLPLRDLLFKWVFQKFLTSLSVRPGSLPAISDHLCRKGTQKLTENL